MMNPRHVWCLISCVFLFIESFAFASIVATINISSPAFEPGQPIPAQYSYKGENISPALLFTQIPDGTKSLALIVDDPDSPSGLWTHWVVWNLPANTTSIEAGKLPSGAVQGQNSFGHVRYDGPVPPSGTHRYFFRVYALATVLNLPAGSDRAALSRAMQGPLMNSGYVIGSGEMFGTYSAK
jgi:Raf kinase inhibitor-like YbhB/YbcL family protein